jgi:basic amino acid/polyamine antiporter, APA family
MNVVSGDALAPKVEVPFTGLRRAVGRRGFFALSFGAVVGSGWIIVLGDWLKRAGPGGTVLGFIAGGTTMTLVALCYGELSAQFPSAGGELLYTRAAFGNRVGFLVAWYLTLYTISSCAFEAIACGVLLRTLLPFIALPVAYQIGSWPVTWDGLLVDVTAAVAIGVVHARGAHGTIRVQNVITYGFICIIGVVIALGLWNGHASNVLPLFPEPNSASVLVGALGIFAVSVFFLNGWQAALHAIEERRTDTPVRSAALWMVGGIAAATAFYIGIVLAASSAAPWRTLVGQNLPAAAAFRALGGAVVATIVVAAALISLIKTWIALAWISSRLILAQARDGLLPSTLGVVHAGSGAPRNAIAFTTAFSIAGIVAGRSALLPIVNMTSICLAMSIIVCLIALVRLRRTVPKPASFSVPASVIGGALFGGLAMIGAAAIAPLVYSRGGIPTEWKLILIWGALGLVAAHTAVRRPRSDTATP